MRILRDIVFRPRIHIGEIATPAAGNAYLFANRAGLINQQNPPASLRRTHHSGGTCPQNNGVKIVRTLAHIHRQPRCAARRKPL